MFEFELVVSAVIFLSAGSAEWFLAIFCCP